MKIKPNQMERYEMRQGKGSVASELAERWANKMEELMLARKTKNALRVVDEALTSACRDSINLDELQLSMMVDYLTKFWWYGVYIQVWYQAKNNPNFKKIPCQN